MLIECLEGEPIKVDGKPILQDLRINAKPSEKKFRIKAKYIESGDSDNKGSKERPIDVIILGYDKVRISAKMIAQTNIYGFDKIHNVQFQISLTYNIIHSTCSVICKYDRNTSLYEFRIGCCHKDIISLLSMFVGSDSNSQ